MARPISLKQAAQVPPFKGDELGIEVVPKPHWAPPKGLDYVNRKNRVQPSHSPEILNLYLDRGVQKSRKGTTQVGAEASAPIMAVVNFVTSAGIGFLLRFLTTRLEQWNGTTWTQVGTAAFTGGTSAYFTYTAFGDTLLFSNGIDGLWEYAPLTGSLTLVPGGPNALHLSTFGSRVIASAANGELGLVQWSVKNNSQDWEGVGSGAEPLLSTPGGKVDALMGVFPVTDDFALMVRSNSIWQVSQTGDPDAPYRFGRLHANLGSRSRHSIDVVPGGVVLLGTDDIWLVTDSAVNPIGQLIKDRVYLENDDITQARGIYRPGTKEYWLVPSNTDILYRYSFQDQGWTRHRYPFDIRWLEQSIFHYEGITWDEMVGSWDTQSSVWDALLGDSREPQFFMVASSDDFVITESDVETDDELISVGKTAQGIEIQTPVLEAATPFEKTEVIECQIEYEQNAVTQTVLIEYATDGGTVWNGYSTKVLTSTGYPQIKRALRTLERKAMQFRLRSTVLGQLTLISFSPFLVVGAKKEP